MDRIFRLELIKELVSQQDFSNQDELQQALAEKGIAITQATLSRDLKTIRAYRITDNRGKSRYEIQGHESAHAQAPALPDHLDGVVSVEFSGQMGVVRTIPGFANAVAYYLDQARIPAFMGTIAGDDTILIIGRSGVSENKLAGSFINYFPSLSNKIN